MTWSLKAILYTRCAGNKTAAIHYCEEMAANYPALRNEYLAYVQALIDLR